MKRDDLDWSVIKVSTVTFIIVLLVSLGMVVGSWSFIEDMLSDYKRNKINFTSLSKVEDSSFD